MALNLATDSISLNAPGKITFDNFGNLWLYDIGNNRVLMYKADPNNPNLFSNGPPASLVIGKPTFSR